ncbi:MAG: alcohol dehydrogenase catalytic domain-containing protein [bacterium]|nr:alcohol dehydrogenase catalytic domain-containing protein [bacterium]
MVSSDKNNRYAWLLRPGVLEFKDEALPASLDPHFARLRIAYCGLCGSDLAYYLGRPEAEYPRTLGHEYFGEIVQVGAAVTAFYPGQQIAVDPNYRCGTCDYCRSGASHLCDSSEANLFHPRGLARFVDVHDSYLHPVPAYRYSWLSALIEPLSAALHAVELSQAQAEQRALILGCGSQGFMLTFALTQLYPQLKIAVYDPNTNRARNLEEAFCPHLLALRASPTSPDYPLVFEATGVTAGFEQACRALKKGGRLVVLSRYRDRKSVDLPVEFPRKEPTVIFSHLDGDGSPFVAAMNLLLEKWDDRYNSLIDIQPFTDLPSVMANLENSPFNKTIIDINQ